MTDRDRLVEKLWVALARLWPGDVPLDAVRQVADAVDQVRPAPRPLPTAELRALAEQIARAPRRKLHGFAKDVLLLLDHIRALEKDLDAAVRQIHDLRLYNEAFEQGRQAGLGEALQEIGEHIRSHRATRDLPMSRVRALLELAGAIKVLGPLPEPATIAALRAELAAAQQQGQSRGTANLEVLDL